MKPQRITTQAALGVALLYAAAPLVHAQQEQDAVETMRPIQFMSGGIGKSDQAYTRNAGKAFKLRIEFSERKQNEFVADVDLRITDMQDRAVFVLHDAGPIVNVDLPDGRYRVAATFLGRTEARLVTLRGKAGEDLYLHWNGAAKGDPDASTASEGTTSHS
jgi:hypothetical protein